MSQQAIIISEKDVRLDQASILQELLAGEKKDYSLLPTENALYMVVKEVEEKKQSTEKIRMIAGGIARSLQKYGLTSAKLEQDVLATLFAKIDEAAAITAFVEGWHLGNYAFSSYLSKEQPKAVAIEVPAGFETAVQAGEVRAQAMSFSRDLMNDIPSALNPSTFPNRLEKEFAGTDVLVTVHDKKAIEAMEMNGVLAVAQGSKHAPAFVELTYTYDSKQPLIALVGKGVTFDTGGISLKGGRDLSDMRMDMGGAAAVAGAMKLLAASKAKVNVVALIPIVENMPDSNSILPGDVIRYKNGHTVQVGNTDAEGRLILADGILRAEALGAKAIIDIATLTGAIWSALGSKLAGVFGTEQLTLDIKSIGDENGDFVWPKPLVDAYDSYLKSDYADFSNISSKGEAGSITAGLFLRRFVPEAADWLHVDMAGVMSRSAEGYYAKSATGFGARLLADFAVHYSK